MIYILPFIFLAVAISAAGLLPGFFPFVTLILLTMLLLDRPCAGRMSRPGLLLNGAFVCGTVLLLFSLCPLPDPLVGAERARAFQRCRDLNESLALLSVDTLYQEKETRLDLPFSRYLFRRIQRWINEDAFLRASPSDDAFEPRARTVRSSLSLNQAGTLRTIFLVTASFACFFLCARSPLRKREGFLLFLVIMGAGIAITGILGKLVYPQGKTLLWLLPVAHGSPIGPFVNRNHFAFFCAILVVPALILATRRRMRGAHSNVNANLFKDVSLRMLCLGCVLVLAGGVIVSLSRSGLLVMIASLVILMALVLRKPSVWGLALVVMSGAMIAGLWMFPMEDFQARKATLQDPLKTGSAQIRLQVWADGIGIWQDFPIFGAGADAFRTVYPTRKSSIARKGAIHAENEYVQVLADNGILGAGLILMALVAYVAALTKQPECSFKPSSICKLVAWATLAGMGVHAFFDFGLRIPLNALLAAGLLGCGMPEPSSGETTSEAEVSAARKAVLKRPFFICTLAILLILMPLANQYWLAAYEMDEYTALENANLSTLTKAVAWAPLYWHPWYESGRRCLEIAGEMKGTQDPRIPVFREMGKGCIWLAAYLNSSDYRVWWAAARIAFEMGALEEADQAARKFIELRPYRSDDVEPYLSNE